MTYVSEFTKENREIMDYVVVLSDLTKTPKLVGNTALCDLLRGFSGRVQSHLDHLHLLLRENTACPVNRQTKVALLRLMSSGAPLKKVIDNYTLRWCNPLVNEIDPTIFLEETDEILHLVKERIQIETSCVLPPSSKNPTLSTH